MTTPPSARWAAAAPFALAAAAACGVAGVAYHRWLLARARAAAPPPLLAGAARLPLSGGGRAADDGAPTIIFIHGMGCSALEWAPVAALLRGARWAALDRVLGVDAARALARPRTAAVILGELREALAAAGVAPPYVLVGHSFGALVARAWALAHRAEVAALLLLDPLHEGFVAPPMPLDFRLAFRFAVPAVFGALALAAPLGAVRLLDAARALGLPPSELLPPAQRAAAVARYSAAAPWRIAAAERDGSFASLPAVRAMGALDATLPVTVVVAGRRDRSPTAFPRALTAAFVAQAEDVLGGRGPLRRLVLAARSEHWVHLDEPALVADEVALLLAAAAKAAASAPRQ